MLSFVFVRCRYIVHIARVMDNDIDAYSLHFIDWFSLQVPPTVQLNKDGSPKKTQTPHV